MDILKRLKSKRLLILGLGREGLNTFQYLREQFPQKQLGLADKSAWEMLADQTRKMLAADAHIDLFLGDDYLTYLAEYDLIFKSPGIPHSLLEVYDPHAIAKVTSNMALFFQRCPGTIIGVTGTKGKSTTTSLIYEVLKAGGRDVRLAGNIGVPALSALAESDRETLFVIELSSYQLADLSQSPQIAVLQNIVPAHLPHHGGFASYAAAKERITQYQTPADRLLYNAFYPLPREIARRSRAQKYPFGFAKTGEPGCFLEDDFLVFYAQGKQGQPEQIIATPEIPLLGKFNLQNVMPAIIIGKLFDLQTDVIRSAIQHFRSLDCRLEFVDEVQGVSFYNDSLSTVPEAAIAAIKAFAGRGITLIAGGFDQELAFTELAQTILTEGVNHLILLPEAGRRIWEAIVALAGGEASLPHHIVCTDMTEIVEQAYQFSNRGDVVLLSPACPSFGLFKDYVDRGDQFCQAVRALRKA